MWKTCQFLEVKEVGGVIYLAQKKVREIGGRVVEITVLDLFGNFQRPTRLVQSFTKFI